MQQSFRLQLPFELENDLIFRSNETQVAAIIRNDGQFHCIWENEENKFLIDIPATGTKQTTHNNEADVNWVSVEWRWRGWNGVACMGGTNGLAIAGRLSWFQIDQTEMSMERATREWEIILSGTRFKAKIGIRSSFVYKQNQIFAATEMRNTETQIYPLKCEWRLNIEPKPFQYFQQKEHKMSLCDCHRTKNDFFSSPKL